MNSQLGLGYLLPASTVPNSLKRWGGLGISKWSLILVVVWSLGLLLLVYLVLLGPFSFLFGVFFHISNSWTLPCVTTYLILSVFLIMFLISSPKSFWLQFLLLQSTFLSSLSGKKHINHSNISFIFYFIHSYTTCQLTVVPACEYLEMLPQARLVQSLIWSTETHALIGHS